MKSSPLVVKLRTKRNSYFFAFLFRNDRGVLNFNFRKFTGTKPGRWICVQGLFFVFAKCRIERPT